MKRLLLSIIFPQPVASTTTAICLTSSEWRMLTSKFFHLRRRSGSTRIRASSRIWKIFRLNVARPCASTHYSPRLFLTNNLTIRSTSYPHPHSQDDDFDFDTNHSLPAYFAPGPTSTIFLPHFPTEYFSSLSRPPVAQANVVASYAHSSSHGHRCMAQATFEPNAQQHWGHTLPLYGANPSLTNYAAAASIMEKHGHQQTQNARQPRTLVPQRHHPPTLKGATVQ